MTVSQMVLLWFFFKSKCIFVQWYTYALIMAYSIQFKTQRLRDLSNHLFLRQPNTVQTDKVSDRSDRVKRIDLCSELQASVNW